MKTFILLLTALLFTKASFSQTQNDWDSFKKYSYSILGFSGKGNFGIPSGGTGFFIRDRSKLFLVTAKHVFSGCDDSAKKSPFYPDIMNVMLHDNIGNPTIVINVNIEKIKDTTPCVRKLNDTDIIVVPINVEDSIGKTIFSVEKFLAPPFRVIEKILMVGFPGIGYARQPVEFGFWKPSLFKMNGNETKIFTHTTYTDPIMIDSINLFMYNQTIEIDSTLKGFSGSPIFVKDSSSKKWRIAGLFAKFGECNTAKEKCIIAPKIDYILSDIDKKSR